MAKYEYQIIYKKGSKVDSKSSKMKYEFVDLINSISAIEKYTHNNALVKVTIQTMLPFRENEITERDKEYLKKYWS